MSNRNFESVDRRYVPRTCQQIRHSRQDYDNLGTKETSQTSILRVSVLTGRGLHPAWPQLDIVVGRHLAGEIATAGGAYDEAIEILEEAFDSKPP